MTLADFESLVLTQRAAEDRWTPVTPYDFASREQIEGRHPDLIVEAFHPAHAIDVGCGPVRVLTRLLRRRGVRLTAVDREDAYAEVMLDITKHVTSGLRGDLVICREVLEHLTVLQIRQAVTNLCALSTRYVYVTTRFHPNPSSLLDVATADDQDPTHISMLHQDFLRVLFVLEGFRRRPDLEGVLDWQQKGRCLVYERA